MKESTAGIVVKVAQLASEQVAEGVNDTAVALVDNQLFIGVGYWQDPEVFYRAIARETAPARRCVFTVPIIVTRRSESEVDFRQLGGELAEAEHEELFILAFDVTDGLDIGRCRIDRDDAGTPIFGDVEHFHGAVQVPPTAPGMSLVQALLPNEEKA